jgi:hypothetical protein
VNARLQFIQGSCEYIMHLYSLFKAYCGTNSPPKQGVHYNKQTGNSHGVLALILVLILSSLSTGIYFILTGLK